MISMPKFMPELIHNLFRTSASASSPTTDTGATRAQNRHRERVRKRFTAVGAVVAVAAIVGSGFAVNSAVASNNESIAAAEAQEASRVLHAQRVNIYQDAVGRQAEQRAENTIRVANAALSDGKGKTDTNDLATSVASLDNYTELPPEQVFDLVDQTNAETASVKEATDKAERIAKEKAAAAKASAKAAAEKKAAEAAAAEKAAAEEAAAEQARAEENSAPSRPSAPTDPSGAQAIARDMMASKYGWGEGQFGCLVSLWDRESGWNVNAYNASSGATGIPQALPGSKMASAGSDWATNPATQIAWGLGYIADRYGDPCSAWDHSESAGWY